MLRRAGRIFLVGVAIVMVVLWVALAGFWVRSYWRGDSIVIRQTVKRGGIWPTLTLAVVSGRGGLAIGLRRLSRERHSLAVDPPDQAFWSVVSPATYPQPLALANVVTIQPPPTPVFTGSITYTPNVPVSSNPADGTLTVNRILNSAGPVLLPAPPTTMNIYNNAVPARPLAGAAAAPAPSVNAWGFHFSQLIKPYTVAKGLGESNRVVILPYWAAVIILAVPTYLLARAGLTVVCRVRQAKAGCCIQCGYDLRATPDRCPECGREVRPPAGADVA